MPAIGERLKSIKQNLGIVGEFLGFFWESQRKMFRQLAERPGVEYITVRNRLLDAEEPVYGRINPHLNEKGQRILADAIRKRLFPVS